MGATEGRSVKVRIAVGGTAVAAALGVGAFLITDHLTRNGSSTTDVAALAPAATSASAPSSSTGRPSPAGSSAGAPSASASLPPVSDAVRKQIMHAREQGAKHGVKVTRPLREQAVTAPVDLRRTTVGTFKTGIVRLVTARSDLTGQQELGWVAGGVSDHGNDHCSQTFRLFNSPAPEKKPTLLLCWRTSPAKSVVAALVDPKGKPSIARALKAVDDKWKSMG